LSAALVLGSVGLASAQPDVADIPSQQLSVAGDPNLSYFLIGPVAKETPAQRRSSFCRAGTARQILCPLSNACTRTRWAASTSWPSPSP
jgi:hypothetical protein